MNLRRYAFGIGTISLFSIVWQHSFNVYSQNDCLCIIGFEPEMNNLNSVQMFSDQFRYHCVFSWVLFQAGNFLNSSAVNFLGEESIWFISILICIWKTYHHQEEMKATLSRHRRMKNLVFFHARLRENPSKQLARKLLPIFLQNKLFHLRTGRTKSRSFSPFDKRMSL